MSLESEVCINLTNGKNFPDHVVTIEYWFFFLLWKSMGFPESWLSLPTTQTVWLDKFPTISGVHNNSRCGKKLKFILVNLIYFR